MRRINQFRNPAFVGSNSQVVQDVKNCKAGIVHHENGRTYVQATTSTADDPRVNIMSDIVIPSGTYRFCAVAYANTAPGVVRIYERNTGGATYTAAMTLDLATGVERQITSDPFTLHGRPVLIRLQPNAGTVNATAMIAEPQLELASTFDAATSGGGFASSAEIPCHSADRSRRAGDAR